MWRIGPKGSLINWKDSIFSTMWRRNEMWFSAPIFQLFARLSAKSKRSELLLFGFRFLFFIATIDMGARRVASGRSPPPICQPHCPPGHVWMEYRFPINPRSLHSAATARSADEWARWASYSQSTGGMPVAGVAPS